MWDFAGYVLLRAKEHFWEWNCGFDKMVHIKQASERSGEEQATLICPWQFQEMLRPAPAAVVPDGRIGQLRMVEQFLLLCIETNRAAAARHVVETLLGKHTRCSLRGFQNIYAYGSPQKGTITP